MKKITYILLPLSLLAVLFIPTSCEDAVDELADAIAGNNEIDKTQLVGEWYTVRFCGYENGQNCSGALNCTDVEPSLTRGMNFIVNTDGSFSGIDAQCNCRDENGENIDGCDFDNIDEQQPGDQASCEALGGNWHYELDNVGMPAWDISNPNQFSLTMDFSDCSCQDENDNNIEGCDNSTVDNMETEQTCLAIGGRWVVSLDTINMTVNNTVDTLSWNFTDYDEAECECHDADDNHIEGCNSDAEDQSSCESSGGIWESEEYSCFTVYNIKQ